MDLKESWNNWNRTESDNSELNVELKHLKKESKHPMIILKRNLLIGMIWGILISLGYVYLWYIFEPIPIRLALLITTIFNIAILFTSWIIFKMLRSDLLAYSNLLEAMESAYERMMKWWNIQKISALFVYPISAVGGFMIGGMIGSGEPPEEFMYQPKILWALLVCLIVLVPLTYLLANWMFKVAYGQYLKQLKQNIDSLKAE